MDGSVAPPPAPPVASKKVRSDSYRSDLSMESDVTYRSLENGDITASAVTLLPESGGSVVSPAGNTVSALSESGSRVIFVNNPGENLEFCDNKVVTAKYSKFNFVPKFYYARLTQVANFYFLLVGAGQIIPSISSTQGLPYQWMVLAIVLTIDAVFAAIEDNARHRADQKMNARPTHVFDASDKTCFRACAWSDVRVGDLLKVCNYEAVPADLLLLAVSEPDPLAPVGICFVETKSLDGETNLKVRQALSCTFSQLNDPRSLGNLPGRVLCEQPNHDVNSFSGRFEPHKGHTIPIDLKNIALRGSVIRNTPYVYGLVLNTGNDTKIMQSSSETPMKTSKILAIVNRGIGILMAALLVLCLLGAVMCSIWVAQNYSRATYLMLNDLSGMAPFRNDVVGWGIYMGYYWILIASFVPITLYVTVAIVKSYQTFFLNRDIHMYDEASDTPALVRNADLNDDLGQVTHIFSDKTGTLTANEMDFRKMSIHGVSYGRGTTEIGREAVRRLGKDLSASDLLADSTPYEKAMENVHFVDPQSEYQRDSDPAVNAVQAAWIETFLSHLAVCHSVVLEHGDDGPKFSASSPDELALVSGARFFGYDFIGRKNGSVSIRHPLQPGQSITYELLEMIDFTSTRKRMSVVVRTPDKRIVLLTKGADSVIFARLHPDNCDAQIVATTTTHLERYASEGLRTLVIAQKEIPEPAYLEWSRAYKNALSDLAQVQRQKRGEPNHIEELEESLEMGLELLGATAIEDRLQDNVTSTIADLARAGIKIWILTGDKEETAINIGFACQLLDNDMERFIINTDTYASSSALYDLLFSRCQQLRSDRKQGLARRAQAIIIDGRSLTMVFNHQVLCDLFLEVSQYCAAVICCRVSPKQKAQVVRLYKTTIPGCRSLSIGDGANDVGMIQEAHIGIGISGHEGMQAVNASDFAIAQFRFLKRLLLVHGHWNYRRMAKLALYVVYKNIILYCACFVLGTLSGGSGTLYYNNMWINGYNIFWTSLPIVVVAVLEQEVPASIADTFPGLYYAGAQGEQFSLKIFACWIAEALYEGAVCALVPAFLVGLTDSRGHAFSRDVCGGVSYCAMILVGWAKLALNVVTWNVITVSAFVLSLALWFGSALVISLFLPTAVADVAFPYVFTLGEFYLLVYVTLLLCLGRDFLYKAFKREFYPEYYHILQEHHQRKTDPAKAKWVPPHLHYALFEADLDQPKPQFDLLEQLATASPPGARASLGVVDREKAYTGFAFSTQVLEDRFINPLRQLVLPVTHVVDVLGRRFGGANAAKSLRAGDDEATTPQAVVTFEDKVKALPVDAQAVYEIQRFQIFAGWGSSMPGHLFITDPPRYTNADMTDGAWAFDLSEWMIDNRFGGSDQWQYSTTFKDFMRDPQLLCGHTQPTLTARERRRLKKKLNKLVGRSVRRRRWVRKEKIIAEIASAVGTDVTFHADAAPPPQSGSSYAHGGWRTPCGRPDAVTSAMKKEIHIIEQ